MNMAALNVYRKHRKVIRVRTHIINQLYPLSFVHMCFVNKSRGFNIFANVIRGALKYAGSGSKSTNDSTIRTLYTHTHTHTHKAAARQILASRGNRTFSIIKVSQLAWLCVVYLP